MGKKMLLLVVVLTVVALTTSSALALSPMGPPTAGLNKGEWRAGVDYAYSEMDVEWSLSSSTESLIEDIIGEDIVGSGKIKDNESHLVMANIGYGLNNDWEVFVRLGGSKIENDDLLFDGDMDFAYGFGTKVTWYKQGNLSLGALLQTTCLNSKEDYDAVDGEIEIEAWETQIAVGPTYKLSDCLSVYGGPFIYMLDGDIDAKLDGLSGSADVEEDSMFGGYVGAQLDIKPNKEEVSNGAFLFGEFMFTGDGWGVGTGIGWKF